MRGQRSQGEVGVGLARGAHRWRFTCGVDDLPEMLACLGELASCPNTPFDQFDAEVVAHQLSERLGGARDGSVEE